uniref:Uncharacterized protein n=1 Tax=Zea mays TaxID=4577 RepID=B8A1I1_MAIZE|nr:unknown [Zea mays]
MYSSWCRLGLDFYIYLLYKSRRIEDKPYQNHRQCLTGLCHLCKTTGAFTIEVLIWADWTSCPENKSSSHILSVLYFLSFSPFHLRTDMHSA